MTDDTMECIRFRLEREQYAHTVLAIREIMPYEPPTPVPGAPVSVEGILNVRGEVVTVVSGRVLLGLNTNVPMGDSWRIIILEISGGWLGVSVDSVEDIVRFHSNEIELSSQGRETPFIKGTVQLGAELLIVTDLLDLEALAGTEA